MTRLREFQLLTPGSRESRSPQFANETRCVAALVERLLPKVTTEGVWKVLFWCVNVIEKPCYLVVGGVCELQIQADVDLFFTLNDEQKKRWAIQTLEQGMEALLPQIGWAPAPFDQAFAGAKALGLKNEWVWRKRSSPSRRLSAEILIQHEVRVCNISMIVRDRSRQVLRQELLVSDMPDEFVFVSYLGALEWESETRVVLIDRSGDQRWAVDL